MHRIFKYEISITDRQSISMPTGARILCVQTQYNRPHIWAKVDPEEPSEFRHFVMLGTGHPLQSDDWKYLGTFQVNEGSFVGHVFEELE